MKGKSNLALAALLLGMLAQGCVKVLHTKPMFDMHAQYLELLAGGKKNLGTMKEILDGTAQVSTTPNAAPYPAMREAYRDAAAAYAEIKAPADKEWSVMQGFQKRAANRSEMHSDWPEWPQVMQDYEYYKTMIPVVQKAMERLNDAQGRFMARANEGGVGMVDMAAYRAELKGKLDALTQAVGKGRQALGDFERRINQHTNDTLGLAQHNKERAGLAKLREILAQIEAQREPAEQAAQSLLADGSLPAKFYRGPGIRRYPAAERFEQAAERLNQLIGAFNAESQKLNRK